jgi:hypothetical protein
MALRKPLVINAGQIEQIQSGDTLDAIVSEVDVVSMNNSNASPIVIGNAVYCDVASGVDLAQADATGTTEVLGLVAEVSIGAAASGSIQTDGILSATTTQWDAVAGTTGGLTAGAIYYLDESTAGLMTETAPSSVSEFVVRVGKGISTTEMEISISPPIKL